MVISSITEILSIALIIPFISLILGNFETNNNKIFSLIYSFINESIILFSIFIIFLYLFCLLL